MKISKAGVIKDIIRGKPSIFLAQIEVYDYEGNISDDNNNSNGKYVLITRNELCLFDVFTDQKEDH